MAKFTLTISDTKDGEVEVETRFSPPVKGPVADAEMTPAQELGVAVMMLAGQVCDLSSDKPKGGQGARGRG